MMIDYYLKGLLNTDPKKRIGANNKDEIKKHVFFANVNFDLVYQRKYIPPEVEDIKKEFESTLQGEEIELKDKDY